MKKLTCADSLRLPLLAALMLMASVRIAAADSLTVQWDLNAEPEVDGYVVHVGNQPNTYIQTFDVGNTDTFTLATVVAGQQYCFAVTAYNGSTTSPKSNEVCGYSNYPPVLTAPGNQSGVVGSAVTLQLAGSDPEGRTISYSATGLPAGLTLSSGSGLISGTPTTVGVSNVTASVSDGVLTTTRSFTWTITAPVNVSPVLTNPGNRSGTVGQAVSLQLQATDANGDVLSYSASGLPAGLAVASGSGLISGTPTAAGTFDVTAIASDGVLFAIRLFTWTIVAPNVAPTLAIVPNQSGTVGVAASLQLTGADTNGDALTYSANGLPGGLTIASSTGLVSGTPTTAGTFAVTATVSDGSLSASRSFTWTIAAANVAPTLAAVANPSGTVGVAASLQLVGADANGNTLSYVVSGLPGGLSVAGGTGLILGTPTTAGTFAVTATVSDGSLSASRSFTWTIAAANVAPTLAAVPNQSGTAGVAASLQLVGADANGNTLSYVASGLPGGLSVAGGTGLISGTPTTAGTFAVTATVSDGSLSASRSFTWTIAAANVAPTLAAVANQSGTAGVAASLQLVGADANGNTLSYVASGLPGGLSVAGGTGLISGTPTTAGTFNVTATVSDGSLSASRSFTWTIAAANVAPTLAPVANQSGTVGAAASLALTGADTNGDSLTYSASGLPGGLTVAAGTGVISGTPTTAGTFNVTASVSDGTLSASRSFTWTIAAANVAPVLTNPGNQTGTVAQAVSVQLQASDANGTPLTFAAVGLPPGLQVSASTGLITGSPTTAGVYAVAATVSDGQLSASQSFSWTIQDSAPQNGAPSLSNPGTQSTEQGTPVTLQLQASDPDNDPLIFSATNLPPGLTVSPNGLISGSPNTAGTYTVTAFVTDGTPAVSKGFTWTIAAANVAPTLAPVVNQSGTVGVATSLQLVGADANGNTLSYVASGLPAGVSVAGGTGLISGTPTTAGTFAVTTAVSDGSLSVTRSFTWTIAVANVAPTLAAVPNQSGTVGVAASLQLTGADTNGDALTYSANGLPGGLTIASSTGLVSGTPATAGTFAVTATVSDGSLSVSRSFTWTIAAANVAPTLAAVANQSGTAGVAASLQLVGADANGNTLSYVASGLPGGLSVAGGTGLISGTPTTPGTFNVTTAVSDGSLSVSRSFTWTIAAANVAPTLAAVANQSGTAGVAASLQLVGADANGNTLSYVASGLPGGLSVAGGTGLISGTPTTPGTFNVTTAVSDGSLSVSRSFTWTIAAANVAPTLAAVANQAGTAGVAASLQLVGADANGNTLSYVASGLPGGLSVAGGTGLISGTPTTAGTFTVMAAVSDGSLSVSRSFTWTIANASQQISSGTDTGKVAVTRTRATPTAEAKDYTGTKARSRNTKSTATTDSVILAQASTHALIDGTTRGSTTSGSSAQGSVLVAREPVTATELVEDVATPATTELPAAVVPGTAPEVTIETPIDQASFGTGALVIFSATAHDAEDGDLSSRVVWTSSLGGKLGTGRTVLKMLRRGVHVITASVTDSDGLTKTTRITILVGQ